MLAPYVLLWRRTGGAGVNLSDYDEGRPRRESARALHHRTVIVAHALIPAGVIPHRAFARAVIRRSLQLLAREVHDIAAHADIVFQHVPRKRVIAVADPQESAEAHD